MQTNRSPISAMVLKISATSLLPFGMEDGVHNPEIAAAQVSLRNDKNANLCTCVYVCVCVHVRVCAQQVVGPRLNTFFFFAAYLRAWKHAAD